MTPRRTRVLGVLMIALIVAVVAIVLRVRAGDESLVAAQAAHVEASRPTPASAAPPSTVAAPAPPPRASSPTPAPHGVELVRSAVPRSDQAPLKAISAPPEGRAMPVDRRGGPANPRAERQLEILSYGFETLDDDLQECLSQWKELDPATTPEVMIGFELDSSGLTRSFVENADDVPFGPKTCLSNAVYGIDWSHIVDAPAKVTKRFTITPRDGG